MKGKWYGDDKNASRLYLYKDQLESVSVELQHGSHWFVHSRLGAGVAGVVDDSIMQGRRERF